jgi:hypothetical protein
MNFQKIYNPVIALLLRSPLHRIISQSTALLTIVGQRSGRRITLPVNYVADDHALLILTYVERTWWRNFRMPAHLTVQIAGERMTGCGRALTEPGQIREKLNVMLHADGNLRRFFGVTACEDGTISGSAKLDQALPGLIIVQVDDLHT